ncbi:Ppx/GppA phosphatase family protein [Stakelama saccharophila]|uniref:Ppx/GppA phosphatase family protein n=1 Tax=Stakelama saccharophila TaxID=3075605 RepID=A0ABZ0B8V8_9SPHN|nr:Ppx/GppA phosphatase family protein [Stakelama sp. W311]WNO53715.1 Ppx/GppA phosphatase family protein [Stakelama sp. W311]
MGEYPTRLPHRRNRASGNEATTSPARERWPGARNYAALDLGTNNCRLLIARPANDGFTVVDAFSRIVRLGEGLASSGHLSEAAIDRTIAALRVCSDKLRRRRVSLARSVATEACRRASNGRAFIERVQRETGIRLDIITAEEEARLAVLGCHALLEAGKGPALVFDIGGGSTELVLIDAGDPVPGVLDWHSAPWGVVSLTEATRAAGGMDGTAECYRWMKDQVADAMRPFAARLPEVAAGRRLLGTSGTVTTLASVHLGLSVYDRSRIDGLIIPAPAMRQVSNDLARMDLATRSAVPCVGRERADLVVAGCAILETILDLWPAERIGVADRGIREGILRRLMHGVGL